MLNVYAFIPCYPYHDNTIFIVLDIVGITYIHMNTFPSRDGQFVYVEENSPLIRIVGLKIRPLMLRASANGAYFCGRINAKVKMWISSSYIACRLFGSTGFHSKGARLPFSHLNCGW